METISLVVPLREGPLRRAAAMLEGLAYDTSLAFNEFSDKVVEAVAQEVGLSPEELMRPMGDTLTAEEVAEGDAHLVETGGPTAAPDTVDAAVVFGAPAEVAAPTAPVVDLDSGGIPWDRRIHTDAKTRRKGDNTWKLIRGVDAALVEQVKAELHSNMCAATVVGVIPLAPSATTVTVFPELVTWVTGKCNSGAVQMQQIEAIVAKYGLTGGLPSVAARPDLIPAIHADMVALWPDTQD